MRPLIRRGAPIAVVAPAGIVDPDRFALGLELLRGHGYDPRPFPGMQQPWRYLAGTDDHRLEQLVAALTAPEWEAVWIARGGYGITRLMPRLAEVIRAEPGLPARPVIGFSDVTALFLMMRRAGAGPMIHGPVVHSLAITDAPSIDHLLALLDGAPTGPLVGKAWLEGEATGELVGGNLCMLAATCGTPWQLDARGCVVVLEEVGEAAYRVDRMLQQIVTAGVLRGAVAVGVGQLVGCGRKDDPFDLAEVLVEQLAPLGIPVVGDLPVGHGAANRAFPWGVRARVAGGAVAW